MTSPTRPLPSHGTQTRYKGARNGSYPPCRCDACKRAHSIGCKKRTLAHLAGQPPLYPGEPLRAHVQHLIERGMSRDLIARRAHVSHATISYLIRGLTQSCRREQALRILAVTPGDFDPVAERPVAGSMRRIRAMYWMGHNPATIAARSGVGISTISHIANGHQQIVQGPVAAAIAAAYRALSTRPGTSTKARRRAIDLGWHGPLAWGGDIDDPAAQPDATGEQTESIARKRDGHRNDEIKHLAGFQLPAHEIARRVGLDEQDVSGRLTKWRGERDRKQAAA